MLLGIYVGKVADSLQEEKRQDTYKRRVKKRERRKTRRDRRQSVRDGVYVTLSTQKNRRSGRDRRANR